MAPLSPEQVRLIVVTDGEQAAPRDLLSVVESALRSGTPCIQLRDKRRSVRELFPLAQRLRELTHRHQALLFINDRVDLALSVAADGVHLGPQDLPVAAVRKVVPESLYIGFSADDPHVARSAVAEGADYIGCGTVWPTHSKKDAGGVVGLDGLRRVAEAVSAPVVAIGGVTVERSSSLRATGASGAAVVSAVMSAPDPGLAVQRLLERLRHASTKKDDPEARD